MDTQMDIDMFESFDVVETHEGAWQHRQCTPRAEARHGVYIEELDEGDLCASCRDFLDIDNIPQCACGRGPVGNLRTHCLECELEPFGIAWQLEQDGRL